MPCEFCEASAQRPGRWRCSDCGHWFSHHYWQFGDLSEDGYTVVDPTCAFCYWRSDYHEHVGQRVPGV